MLQKLRAKSSDPLQGVILEPKLEERLRDVAIATKNTIRNNGLYRNILLHGAPGTSFTTISFQFNNNTARTNTIIELFFFMKINRNRQNDVCAKVS